MTNEERIAREALKAKSFTDWRDVARDATGAVIVEAARLGIEHGERESAAKIADMKATLEHYAGTWGEPQNNAAAACLARNFPAPKPSLREAARDAEAHLRRMASTADKELADALRDALAREEGKP